MAMPRTLKSLGRFTKNIIKHPGSWILGSLIAVGVAFAMPAIAPALVIAAALATAIAAPIALIFQAVKWFGKKRARDGSGIKILEDFIKAHPFQFAAILLAVGLLVTALVLTIGFFTGGGAFAVVGGVVAATGGGAFAFMAPVFAAIAAPFATAATSWGISLCLPALAGFCLTIAALNLPNTIKRFLGWLDSFKYDGAIGKADGLFDESENSENDESENSENIDWSDKEVASEKVNELLAEHIYPKAVISGIFATVKNGFSSRYEEELAEAAENVYIRVV